MYEAMLVAQPTRLSVVDVTAKGADSVEDKSVTDITVTYTATDTIYTQRRQQKYDSYHSPVSGWEPAYPPHADSVAGEPDDFIDFGDDVLDSIPRTNRTDSSYVVFKASLKSKAELKPEVSFGGILVEVPEMESGDGIVVTFHNVMVDEDVGSAAQDAQFDVVGQYRSL